jgi:hypothetical protein
MLAASSMAAIASDGVSGRVNYQGASANLAGMQQVAYASACRDNYYAYQHPGNCGRHVPNPCGDNYYAYQHPGNCGRHVPNPCLDRTYSYQHPGNCRYRHPH